jgi:hypothetical protein
MAQSSDKPLRSAAIWSHCRLLSDLPDAAQELVLADITAPDAVISAISTSKARAEPYRPAVGQDPETAGFHHRGRVRQANYGR